MQSAKKKTNAKLWAILFIGTEVRPKAGIIGVKNVLSDCDPALTGPALVFQLPCLAMDRVRNTNANLLQVVHHLGLKMLP